MSDTFQVNHPSIGLVGNSLTDEPGDLIKFKVTDGKNGEITMKSVLSTTPETVEKGSGENPHTSQQKAGEHQTPEGA